MARRASPPDLLGQTFLSAPRRGRGGTASPAPLRPVNAQPGIPLAELEARVARKSGVGEAAHRLLESLARHERSIEDGDEIDAATRFSRRLRIESGQPLRGGD